MNFNCLNVYLDENSHFLCKILSKYTPKRQKRINCNMFSKFSMTKIRSKCTPKRTKLHHLKIFQGSIARTSYNKRMASRHVSRNRNSICYIFEVSEHTCFCLLTVASNSLSGVSLRFTLLMKLSSNANLYI